jgi:hypothetical protein
MENGANPVESDPDSRSFALGNFGTMRLEQRFDV